MGKSVNRNPENLFFTGINLHDIFFFDRKQETEEIINRILNGYSRVLKSPRRVGKSA